MSGEKLLSKPALEASDSVPDLTPPRGGDRGMPRPASRNEGKVGGLLAVPALEGAGGTRGEVRVAASGGSVFTVELVVFSGAGWLLVAAVAVAAAVTVADVMVLVGAVVTALFLAPTCSTSMLKQRNDALEIDLIMPELPKMATE